MKQANQGYEYIEGDDQQSTLACVMACCGKCVGTCKAWMPCVGCCMCCFNYPFVSIPQGSKGLLLNFKKYIKTCNPGLHYVNVMTQQIVIIDCRITVVNIPTQRVMTRDNVPIAIQSCIYYHVQQPHLMYYRVDNIEASLIKVSGGIIKNTVSIFTFQQLLEKKQDVTQDIEKQIKPIIADWGIKINNTCLKNFAISKQLQAQLVSAPIARRNAASKIINSQGQVQIAKILGQRSKVLDSPTAIQVRYLETLKGLARVSTSKMIYRSL